MFAVFLRGRFWVGVRVCGFLFGKFLGYIVFRVFVLSLLFFEFYMVSGVGLRRFSFLGKGLFCEFVFIR